MPRDCGIPVLRNPNNNPIIVSVCPGGWEFEIGVRVQAIPPGPCSVGPRDVRAVFYSNDCSWLVERCRTRWLVDRVRRFAHGMIIKTAVPLGPRLILKDRWVQEDNAVKYHPVPP